MENRKITAETIVEMELYSLGEAIGNCLELNDDFISRYCGELVAAQLRRIPESEREYILHSHIGEGRAVGGFYSLGASSIVIPVGEIEYQFDGAPEDTFDDVDVVYISGNYAYVSCDAAEFPVDVAALETEIDEFLSGEMPDEFAEAYKTCALWSSTDFDGVPLDDNFDADDISRESRKIMESDCADFWSRNGFMMADNPSRAGHDFWLTRNGHGAGFWDGQWPEHGERLTSAAKIYGGVDLYVGDDEKIHCV